MLIFGGQDTVPDDIQRELEREHEERCQNFAAVTLPRYKEDPSTWLPDSFDKVLTFIIPYIAYLRLLGTADKYPNLDQLFNELNLIGIDPDGWASYAKQTFKNNERLHAELVVVVDEGAKSETSGAGGK